MFSDEIEKLLRHKAVASTRLAIEKHDDPAFNGYLSDAICNISSYATAQTLNHLERHGMNPPDSTEIIKHTNKIGE